MLGEVAGEQCFVADADAPLIESELVPPAPIWRATEVCPALPDIGNFEVGQT